MKQKGFNLIELMIVIAIVGILAMIAVPAYTDYVTRARVAEGIQLASSAKAAVAEYEQSMGKFPKSNSEAGLAAKIAGKYVSNIQISDKGIISISYNELTGVGENNIIAFVPKVADGSITWSCGGEGTTVAKNYLPSVCRAKN